MKLFIMRHGHAVPGDFRTPDEARWLSELGREAATRAGRALRAEGFGAGAVVTSPLVRAVQSAELAASALGFAEAIVALLCLRSEASPQSALEELRALPNEAVLAVTHEPLASKLSSLLSGTIQASLRPAEIRGFEMGRMIWRFV